MDDEERPPGILGREPRSAEPIAHDGNTPARGGEVRFSK